MMEENEPLSDQVFHELLALMRMHRQYARHISSEKKINPRSMSVLYFLSENEAVTVSQVQQYIQHSPSTTSTLIAKLEKSGFVTRTRSQTDNRVVLVAITDAGRRMMAQTPLGGLPLLRRQMRTLSAERLTEMSSVLIEIQILMEGEEAQ